MRDSWSDEPETDPPTALERLPLPFDVHDELVEPLPSFMVVCVIFDRPVEPGTMDGLTRVLDEWLATNAAVAQAMGELGPEAEALQTGDQTVEFQIQGAQGYPDATLAPMLEGLARISRSGQRIVQVEMD